MVVQTDAANHVNGGKGIAFTSLLIPRVQTPVRKTGFTASKSRSKWRVAQRCNVGKASNSKCRMQASSDPGSVTCATMKWAREIVCGLGLCPFAQGVLDDNTVRVKVYDCKDELEVLEKVGREATLLVETPAEQMSTTLVVMPQFAERDFERFYEHCQMMERWFEQDERFADEIMLACFHPYHRWLECESTDEAVNYDRRAPYPTVNLLRAEQVDVYIAQGKTQHILERNKGTLERIGPKRLGELYGALTCDMGV